MSRHDLWQTKAVAPKRSTGQNSTQHKKNFTGFTDIFKRAKVVEAIVIDDDPTLPMDDLPEPFSPVTDDFGMPTSSLYQQHPLDISTSSDASDVINRSVSSSNSSYKFTPPTSGQPVASNSSRFFKSSASSVPSRHQILNSESTPSSLNISEFGADTSCDSDVVVPSGIPSIRKTDFDKFGDSSSLFVNDLPEVFEEVVPQPPKVLTESQQATKFKAELAKLNEKFNLRKALCVRSKSVKHHRAAFIQKMNEKIAAMDKEVDDLDESILKLDRSIVDMSASFR